MTLEQSTAPSAAERPWPVGLVWLVPPGRFGGLITGFALFFSLVVLFSAAGLFSADSSPELAEEQLAALFFSVLIAYIVPMFHFISGRTIRALDALAGQSSTTAGDEHTPTLTTAKAERSSALLTDISHARRRVLYKPRGWMMLVLGIGIACAVLHNAALFTLGDFPDIPGPTRSALVVGTTVTWLVMMLVIASLMDNALRLRRIAQLMPLNPLQPAAVRPIASVAVASTLAVVGAQAAFPLLMIDADASAVASLPGLVATTVPMITLALLPIWPLHVRLRDERQQLLDAIDRRLDALGKVAPGDTPAVDALLAQLAYRREVRAASTWPIDLSIAARLAFYVTIPPLTWVAAALIERVVDRLI